MTPEEFQNALCPLRTYLESVATRTGAIEDAKDVAHDIFINISKRPPEQFTDVQHLRRYGAKAVRRRRIELAMGKGNRSTTRFLEEMTSEQVFKALERQLARPEDPYEICEREDMLRLVRTTVELLPPLERAIAKAMAEGQTGPSIASQHGLTRDVVRGLRERLARKLRETFKDFLRKR